VSFAYETKPDELVLENCSFRVPSRQVTLIVGRSGSGKTTIARLLLGFLKPASGAIDVLGSELESWTGPGLRGQMSYVSQGDHVIDDSVGNNFFAGEDVDATRMRETLSRVGVRADLDSSATELSIGEKQRLSVARMLVDTSEIVIMDEPLSGVDVFTFRELLPHLLEFLHGERTVLMVSHRLAFAAHADHVVVLGDHGSVVEEGAPAELVRRGGHFAALYEAARVEIVIR
jgi:ABC-type multidrug transport system fused ATPase/permease subunit